MTDEISLLLVLLGLRPVLFHLLAPGNVYYHFSFLLLYLLHVPCDAPCIPQPAPIPMPRRVLTAAQLLAERMDRDAPAGGLPPQQQGASMGASMEASSTGNGSGFDWCAEQLRSSGHPLLAAEVLLSKAGRFLVNRDVASATAVFKEFENKESGLRCVLTADAFCRGRAIGSRAGVHNACGYIA